MSIPAMNWAFAQRGLKPATKLVLVCLADCHNAHTRRCDPSQETLAQECCMSRSTVNVHLKLLEEQGLIRRVQRSDKRTRKQLSSLYLLGCDMEEAPAESGEKPVSENRTRDTRASRVRKSDTGQGRAVSGKQPVPCPDGRTRT